MAAGFKYPNPAMEENTHIKAVVFDVDGTLYNQRLMRFFMLFEILFGLITFRLTIKDIKHLRWYRAEREKLNGLSLANLKTAHFSIIAQKKGLEYSSLVRLIVEWMYKRPLKYLPIVRSNIARKNIRNLREKDVAVFFYSDYPLYNKMKKMGYDFNSERYWSSLDMNIASFKPNPAFLIFFKDKYLYHKDEILVVGDRDDRDKAMADNFGCRYMDIRYFNRQAKNLEFSNKD